jgi:hypothetical protein
MRIALITEGVSEYKVVKYIIEKYHKDIDPKIIQIQPLVINDKQETVGGWVEVLKYCSRDNDLREIFYNGNDYLIIQIDTDQSQEAPFSISHNKEVDNKSKSVEELYLEVVEKLRSLINVEILQEYGDKIIFAISIHSIECWFLPIYFTNNDKSKTSGCIDKLNQELSKKLDRGLPKTNKNDFEAQKTYSIILKNWNNKKAIIDSAKHNFAFNKFIEDLDAIE